MLETRFIAAGGTAVVTDVMPVASEQDKHLLLLPDHEILRIVRCEQGELELAMLLEARPGYGAKVPRAREAGKLGVRIETEQGTMMLRADVPLSLASDATGSCTPPSCSRRGCASCPDCTPAWRASNRAPLSPASSSRPDFWP